MNTKDKSKVIRTLDIEVQDLDDESLTKNWESIVVEPFNNAKGSGYGWAGIAEDDPEVIEELFPQVVEFAMDNSLTLLRP